ncbi:hypothetical protein [Capnocytophaga canimorsus]|uniref:hypothetical protein n=1 Tax=Capnocytophaga canimorsus TaxID=28188 RepID=UPI001AD5D0DA|nr:hypothetical protein [Capnocytophaga canimorsus]GIM58458.1 hypothetical protein CAPN007_06650 [Capnocytophaga canimorsus]
MKKHIYVLAATSLMLLGCGKDWTETQSKAKEFEDVAWEDLKENKYKHIWLSEQQRKQENDQALKAYFADLREYKKKAWLNTGENGGQTPFFYFWYASPTWRAENGVARTWLQAVPDSVTCISLWGALDLRPDELTSNMKKDLEVFHEKGSSVLMCWQTPEPGIGLLGKKGHKYQHDESPGVTYFKERFPFETHYEKWPELYARDLARYIIVMGLDGYDLDWELSCGDHLTDFKREQNPLPFDEVVSKQRSSLMLADNNYENITKFIKEIAKYFGPKYTGAERQKYIEDLFNPATQGFDKNEEIFINEFKSHLPQDYATKKYYLCADLPCNQNPVTRIYATIPIFDSEFAQYFDKHFMQDYSVNGIGSIRPYGGVTFNTTSADYQREFYGQVEGKAKAVAERKVWGFAAYHGQSDYANTHNQGKFKEYTKRNKIKRKYSNYAWTREAIRISDPRPSYSNYKEIPPYIITP